MASVCALRYRSASPASPASVPRKMAESDSNHHGRPARFGCSLPGPMGSDVVRWLLATLALAALAPRAHAQQAAPPTPAVHAPDGGKRLQAHPLGDGAIELDGQLSEPAWKAAPVAADFVERDPVPGATPPVRTELRVLYDRDTIYVGLRAELFPGEVPKADNLTRDLTRVWRDEAFSIKLDVRHDRRTTVVFAFNPAGTQLDALAVENGRVFRREFDAVWEVETHVGEGYWSAEVALPVAALGLPTVEGDRVMGLNITRIHNTRGADYDWSHLPPEFGAWAATHYGELHGVRDINTGHPLSLQPYVRFGHPEDPEGDLIGGFKTGGDVRLRIGNDTWTELTLLTDFAQVDADDQVINFDRFPLFFPERRPFFLSGLGVFDFGEPQQVQLLFTRRIGLDSARKPVPILGGFKLYGTEGVFDYGFLQVITDDTTRLEEDPDDPTAEPVEVGDAGANWSLGRARINFGNPGHVGVIVGVRNNIDLPHVDEVVPVSSEPHLSLGADLLARPFDERFEVSGFSAFTRSSADQLSEGSAHRLALRWIGQEWRPSGSLRFVSEDFDPQIGFVRRKAAIHSAFDLPYVYRTTDLGLKTVTARATTAFVHDDKAEDLLARTAGGDLELDWLTGWAWDLGMDHQLDVVQRPFPLFDDLSIQPDRYEGAVLGVRLASPTQINPDASITYSGSNAFFSGVRHAFSPGMSVSLGRHLRLSGGATLSLLELGDCIEVPDEETGEPVLECGGLERSEPIAEPVFTERRRTLTVNSAVSVTPNTELSVDLTLQLNTSQKRGVGLLRMRYRYLPGSDIFLVYQEDLDYEGDLQSERSVILKAAYRYDDTL